MYAPFSDISFYFRFDYVFFFLFTDFASLCKYFSLSEPVYIFVKIVSPLSWEEIRLSYRRLVQHFSIAAVAVADLHLRLPR